MAAVRRGLLQVAGDLRLPRGRYPDAADPSRDAVQPQPLELAALAIEASQALELIAAEQVERARELDGVTWEQVGLRFGTTMQSAHARFRQRS